MEIVENVGMFGKAEMLENIELFEIVEMMENAEMLENIELQSGRSCAKPRRAFAEKFGLGRQFHAP